MAPTVGRSASNGHAATNSTRWRVACAGFVTAGSSGSTGSITLLAEDHLLLEEIGVHRGSRRLAVLYVDELVLVVDKGATGNVAPSLEAVRCRTPLATLRRGHVRGRATRTLLADAGLGFTTFNGANLGRRSSGGKVALGR